jgi:hypothetical protein
MKYRQELVRSDLFVGPSLVRDSLQSLHHDTDTFYLIGTEEFAVGNRDVRPAHKCQCATALDGLFE